MKNLLIIVGLLLLLAIAFYITQVSVGGNGLSFLGFGKSSKVTINDQTYTVTIADTPAEKAKGLSGKKSLGKDQGMLFIFNPKETPSFWMKDMQFPIDMIFISDGKIVTIHKNVQPPSTGAQNLPIYKPTTPVDDVLEINAGQVDQKNLKEGDTVTISL